MRSMLQAGVSVRGVQRALRIGRGTMMKYAAGCTIRAGGNPHPVSAETAELIRCYRLCGYSADEIADAVEVTTRTVRTYTRGLRRRRAKAKSVYPVALVASWRARRRAGEALSSIAADGEATRQIIARYTADIEIRAKHPTTFDRGRIVELAAKGLSDAQIAARLGCSPALPWHYRKDLAA